MLLLPLLRQGVVVYSGLSRTLFAVYVKSISIGYCAGTTGCKVQRGGIFATGAVPKERAGPLVKKNIFENNKCTHRTEYKIVIIMRCHPDEM